MRNASLGRAASDIISAFAQPLSQDWIAWRTGKLKVYYHITIRSTIMYTRMDSRTTQLLFFSGSTRVMCTLAPLMQLIRCSAYNLHDRHLLPALLLAALP